MSCGLALFVGMIIGIVIGVILGIILMGFLILNDDYDELVDAYNDGFIDGKEAASKKNNTWDNEYNNIRY